MTDARPLFSVVIPTFNRASKVARAVESVLVQTMPDFDIWVIDDGSTDHTNQMLAPYLDRIHYLYQANRGVAGARNQGILQSSGAYIALLDSDDRWRPNKLESIATAVRAHSDSGLFYSQCEVVTETGERLWVDRSRSTHGNAYLQLLMGDFLAASTAVIKRESLNQVGLFDSSVQPCEDWDLWLRIARYYPICLIPKVLVSFEYSSPDKITANTMAWLNAHDKVIEKAFSQNPGLSPATQQAVRANIAYIKGRICLQANGKQDALHWFSQSISLRPTFIKAHFYRILSSVPLLGRFLPQSLRRKLRLTFTKGRMD